jgi:hypothetical protein
MRIPLVVAAALLVFPLGGCPAHTTPNNAKVPDAGISLALYADGETAYAVVDDRRWLEISGTKVLLGNIDPGAALASLVIETANPALRMGPCSREKLPEVVRDPLEEFGAEEERRAAERMRARMRRPLPNVPPVPRAVPVIPKFAPIVTCDVAGPAGRQLVRIVYVSSTLTYRAQHDIEVAEGATATLDSRYAITTPPWRTQADVALFDGVPGGEHLPRELVRGQITLDGGTSVLVIPTRSVPMQLRRIYTGQLVGEADPEVDELSPYWAGEGLNAVWATLELPGTTLSPGNARVHVDRVGEQQRWVDVAPALLTRRDDADKRPLRLPLWVDDTLRGALVRSVVENDGQRMVESFAVSVANVGDTPREVWIEAEARRAKRRRVERPWPKKPTASGDVVRSVVDVKPGKLERAGYLVVYEL